MSIKKSSIFVVAIVLIITLIQVFSSGGNTMQLDMGTDSMSFSGIDDFRYEVAYADMAAAELIEVSDWAPYGGHEFGPFRVGDVTSPDGTSYILFVTTRADNAIVITLTDSRQVIFNYNSNGNTEGIYNMLLNNIN